MAHQDVIDLKRRDVHPAPDDQILGPPRDPHETVPVHHGEIARLEARQAAVFPLPVGRDRSDAGLRPADGDLALDVRRARLAVGIDDDEFLVPGGRAHGPHTPAVVPVAADPAGLGHAVELEKGDAVHLLEFAPLVGAERRGRAGHQAKRGHVVRRDSGRLVQQHVDHRRNPGGEGDAVVADPVEEPPVREAPGDVHGEPGLQERHQAEDLGGVPAEGPVFEGAVVRREPEHVERRQSAQPVGGVVEDDAFGLRCRAGGAEDRGDVGDAVPRLDPGRRRHRTQPGEESVGAVGVPIPEDFA